MITQTDSQLIQQLDTYRPATKGVTSTDEIRLISDTLQLRERNPLSLRNLRNTYVLTYNLRQLQMKGASAADFLAMSDAMMSVTFVIDLFLIQKGEAV